MVIEPEGAKTMPKRSELTVAQRRDAVLALLRREEPAEALARRWGVSEPTLYRWRDEFLAAGEAALAHGKNGADVRDRENRELRAELEDAAKLRRTRLLDALSIAASSWYRQPVAADQRRPPGPAPQPIAETVRQAVVTMALANPWYGYKRIAVMCRRAGQAVQDRQAYVVMREAGLLQKPRPREPELYQAAKLFELLPQRPNDLWQMDVTYLHIPGHGWWYAGTVIDYYSRYLLACHLTNSYSAVEVTHALGEARKEAERLCGPLDKPPFLVTDNGPSFIARRFASFLGGRYRHVRIAYRTPQQLGLLERAVGDPHVPVAPAQ